MLKILLFERVEERRNEIIRAFSEKGYSLRVVTEEGAILGEAEVARPHLVILDVDPPQGPGISLVKSLHDLMPQIPIVAQTANPTVEGAVEVMRWGAYNYVSKYDVSRLVDIAEHALEKEKIRLAAIARAQERRIRSLDYPGTVGELDGLLAAHRHAEPMLITYLQDMQKHLNYLPQDALRFVAARVGVSLARVYSIATFYKSFSLRPRGRHLIHVCLGTACHVRGGNRLLESFERALGVQAGATTYDNSFTLESVRCVGCCGLAPVVMVDGRFFGKMTQDKVAELIARYE